MNTVKIMSVVGARPNFMKIAPFVRAIHAHNDQQTEGGVHLEHYLVHTGQHYDQAMSDTFFRTLGIPEPDVDLEIGSGSHAQQVGQTMIAFEEVARTWKPDWIVVVGDVNATCACSITAKKDHIKLAHIEAGLRSFDLEMPEEINRLVTDRLSDLLFTTDEFSDRNLEREGTEACRIARVGNIMIDTLESHRETAARLDVAKIFQEHQIKDHSTAGEIPDLKTGAFAVLTLHRPSNVDDPEILEKLVEFLIDEVAKTLPLIWLIHPRTRKKMKDFGLWDRICQGAGVYLLNPVGYLEMVKLNMDAQIMLTDSGGLQEECCVLGTPCLTLRWNTERPKTLVEHGGVSLLVGNDVEKICESFKRMVGNEKKPHRPDLWDGNTAPRIVKKLVDATE